jgi:hypothetical protein
MLYTNKINNNFTEYAHHHQGLFALGTVDTTKPKES